MMRSRVRPRQGDDDLIDLVAPDQAAPGARRCPERAPLVDMRASLRTRRRRASNPMTSCADDVAAAVAEMLVPGAARVPSVPTTTVRRARRPSRTQPRVSAGKRQPHYSRQQRRRNQPHPDPQARVSESDTEIDTRATTRQAMVKNHADNCRCMPARRREHVAQLVGAEALVHPGRSQRHDDDRGTGSGASASASRVRPPGQQAGQGKDHRSPQRRPKTASHWRGWTRRAWRGPIGASLRQDIVAVAVVDMVTAPDVQVPGSGRTSPQSRPGAAWRPVRGCARSYGLARRGVRCTLGGRWPQDSASATTTAAGC